MAGDIELAASVFRNALLAGSVAEAQHAVLFNGPCSRKPAIAVLSEFKDLLDGNKHTLFATFCTTYYATKHTGYNIRIDTSARWIRIDTGIWLLWINISLHLC